MLDPVSIPPPRPYESATELRHANAQLVEELDRRLGDDSRPEREVAALRALDGQIREFLGRGVAAGAFIEEIRERTACQVMLDYWTSTLAHAGIPVDRRRLSPFDAARLPDLRDVPCPYVGLDTFHDRTYFFGRDKALESLLQRVAELPLVVVQGASGSGKSSLVLGGALPVLSAANHVPRYRVVGPLTPGNTVLENLAAAATGRTGGDLAAEAAALRADPARLVNALGGEDAPPVLLVIDQFEEVFTLCKEGDRDATVACLDALMSSGAQHRIILTLREEFSEAMDTLQPFRDELARHARFSMKEWPMGYDELKAVVEGPAEKANLHFAPGIVDEMVKSVLGRDTALPLLQFALRALWESRDRNRITREVYQRIGGSPLVALERSADDFYNGLLREEQDEVKRILLELVHIDRMLEPYRWPRLRSDLLHEGTPRTEAALALLERERFVRITPTAAGHDAVVEVKHEALLRNWPRYIDWINGKRERVRQRIALTEVAQRWDDAGRSASEGLLGGWQLQEVVSLTDLSPLEAAYVKASRDAADAESRARERAVRRQERRRVMVMSGAALLVLIGVFVGYVLLENDRRSVAKAATEEMLNQQVLMARTKEASSQARVNYALKWSVETVDRMSWFEAKDRQGTLLDRLWFWRQRPVNSSIGVLRRQARETLLVTLGSARNLRWLYVDPEEGATCKAVAFQPGSVNPVLAYASSDGKVRLANIDRPAEPELTMPACEGQGVNAIAFEPSGERRRLAVGCNNGLVEVWSTEGRKKLGMQRFDFKLWTIAFSPDGKLIAAGGYSNQVALLSVGEDGALSLLEPVGGKALSGFVWAMAFSPDGNTLLAGDGVDHVLKCARETWKCARSEVFPGSSPNAPDAIRAIAYAPDGMRIAIGHDSGRVDVLDDQLSQGSRRSIDLGQLGEPIHSLAFFEACGRPQLAIGRGTTVLFRDVSFPPAPDSGDTCAVPSSAPIGDETYSLAFHGPSGLIAAATRAGYVAVVAPADPNDLLRSVVPMTPASPLRAAIVDEAGDGTALLAVSVVPEASGRGAFGLRRLRNGRIDDGGSFATIAVGGEVVHLAASAPGRRIASVIKLPPAASSSEPSGAAYEVTVWQLGDDRKTLTKLRSVTPADFGALVPARIAMSPDARWLVVAFEDEKSGIGGVADGHLARVLLARADGQGGPSWVDTSLSRVREIAFDSSSKLFAAGGKSARTEGDEVQLWDVGDSGLQQKKAPPMSGSQASRVASLGFAEYDRRPMLLVGGSDGVIRWWAEDGTSFGVLRAGSRSIYQIAFSHGASLVAATDSQNVVRVWDTRSYGEMSSWMPIQLTSTERGARPESLAFGGDGAWLVSGASSLQLWDLDLDSLDRKARALLHAPIQAK